MAKELLIRLTEQAVPIIDLLALLFILLGTIQASIAAVGLMLRREQDPHLARMVWLRYSRWLVAGLTFQLAADIIETSLTPNWQDIARIGAIAVIRTFLNYFLERDQGEVRELQRKREAEKASTGSPEPAAESTVRTDPVM